MSFYRNWNIIINENDVLFSWCQAVTNKANNLKNAVRFRQRQVFTSRFKDQDKCTENELAVINEFVEAGIFPGNGKTHQPGYWDIDFVFKHTKNPDYYAKGLPRQSAQHVIKEAVSDMDAFFKAMQSYKKDPSRFTGKPELPGYCRKGGNTTVHITNQDCTIREGADGQLYAGLPLAKKHPLCIGHPKGRLKEIFVSPVHGVFKINFVFEVNKEQKEASASSKRIAAIDFGVDNLMAVTNNCGLSCLLYKGGIVKSANQHYNKELARIVSEETSKPDCRKGKDGLPEFTPTSESQKLTLHKNNLIMDQMHKTALHLITWCVENRIDTIVAGVNKDWKQSVDIGKVNNQNFVQIPHAKLCFILSYLAEEYGILYLEQEESYTSKASFLDNDFIPVYGVNDEGCSFSGRRRPTRYKGMYNPSGFRGLYEAADGTVINSDLNGSANILRKRFPDAFKDGTMPDFNYVLIFKNANLEFDVWNRESQVGNKKTVMSHAKAERMKKRIRKCA